MGETGRTLGIRMRDHMRPVADLHKKLICSAVGVHSLSTYGEQPITQNWDFIILDRSNVMQNRRIFEAYYIKKCKAEFK